MSDWTQEEAQRVLDDSNAIRITHQDWPGVELYVLKRVNGLYEAWYDAEGSNEPVGYYKWGTFDVVGFDIVLGNDEQAESIANSFVRHGAEDRRDRKTN